jgi:hypothetical protein
MPATHFKSSVLTSSTTNKTPHFVLRVVSAEFHTSKLEARY